MLAGGQMGEERLGMQLVIFMSVSLYVGNGLKDLVCAPRPFQAGEVRPILTLLH